MRRIALLLAALLAGCSSTTALVQPDDDAATPTEGAVEEQADRDAGDTCLTDWGKTEFEYIGMLFVLEELGVDDPSAALPDHAALCDVNEAVCFGEGITDPPIADFREAFGSAEADLLVYEDLISDRFCADAPNT